MPRHATAGRVGWPAVANGTFLTHKNFLLAPSSARPCPLFTTFELRIVKVVVEVSLCSKRCSARRGVSQSVSGSSRVGSARLFTDSIVFTTSLRAKTKTEQTSSSAQGTEFRKQLASLLFGPSAPLLTRFQEAATLALLYFAFDSFDLARTGCNHGHGPVEATAQRRDENWQLRHIAVGWGWGLAEKAKRFISARPASDRPSAEIDTQTCAREWVDGMRFVGGTGVGGALLVGFRFLRHVCRAHLVSGPDC